jgi:hypothetical protein
LEVVVLVLIRLIKQQMEVIQHLVVLYRLVVDLAVNLWLMVNDLLVQAVLVVVLDNLAKVLGEDYLLVPEYQDKDILVV